MPIINTNYGAVPTLTNPANIVDVANGKEYIDGEGEKRVGGAPNYTKLLQAQGIIPAPAGSVDLMNEDFGAYTEVNGIFAFNTQQGNIHPLRSITANTLTSIGQMAYTKNLKYMRVNNLTMRAYQAQFSGLSFIDIENTDISANNSLRDTPIAAIIIRDNTVVHLQYTGTFTNTPIENGSGHIYVPANLVESYKTATTWAIYASVITPLYIVNSETERQEKLADDTVVDSSMIVFDNGEWDFATMTGIRYTVKGSV